ncbi:hypothetical protein PTRA_b0568 [Pseudoalteromonas translucida KMM 520]|uniref:Uncharacterized protein n=1 Tax=Pseudoalteromonas translucida KMM 520 TaxID=1315283 RepID=A0A0U2X8I6_9GAMM|nr:hypothetical protein PTRA_b0568 [Pseudoalteromonas translucida KMM 520]
MDTEDSAMHDAQQFLIIMIIHYSHLVITAFRWRYNYS